MRPHRAGLEGIAVLAAILVVGAFSSSAHAQTATVNWNAVDQMIDGFGGSDNSYHADYTKAQAELFFSTTKGIGLSLLRVGAYTEPGRAVPLCKTMQEAVARGAKVWASEWSPPAAWKSNHSEDHGGYLLPQHYQDYANFQTQYVKDVKSQCGISLYAFSVQNEPNFDAPYASADWTAQYFHDYILNSLGPTFAANGITAKIMIPEELSWDFGEASATINDPNAAKYVSIVATHDYTGIPAPYPAAQDQGKHLWVTEVSDFKTPDRKMDSALHYAMLIHGGPRESQRERMALLVAHRFSHEP
jgi:glucuronoarabinoxylan endo-1,4-beta-xylanase